MVHRAGPTAAALWGSSVTGLTDSNLHGLRLGSLQAVGRVAKGSSVGLRIAATKAGRRSDPARLHCELVMQQWATTVWEGYPKLQLHEKTLQGARQQLAKAKCK